MHPGDQFFLVNSTNRFLQCVLQRLRKLDEPEIGKLGPTA